MSPLESAHTYHLTFPALLAGSSAICTLVMGVAILLKDRHSSVASRFVVVLLSSAAFYSCFAMMFAATEELDAEQWLHAGLFVAPFMPVAFLHFATSSSGGERRMPAFVALALVAAFGLGVVGLNTGFVAHGFRAHEWGRYPRAGPGLPLYALFTLIVLAAGAFGLWRQYRTEPNGARRDAVAALARAYGIGCLMAVDFLPAFGVLVYPFGSVCAIAFGAQALMPDNRPRFFPMNVAMAADHLVQTMADALVVIDRDGKIQLVNHAVESLFGYAEQELVGRGIDMLVVSEGVGSSQSDRVRTLMHGGPVREIERRFRARDGTPIPVSISMSAMSPQGGTAGIVMVVRDIRERRKTEEDLRRTASLLRSTLDSTDDGILVVDSSGRIVSHNQRFAKAWQIPEEGLEHGTDEDFVRAVLDKLVNPDMFLDAMMKASALAEAQSFDVVELIDGRVFERVSIPQHLDGRTVGRVWSFREVTARRRSEAALKASEQRYRLLFERNAAGVYRASIEGSIVDCNDAYAKMFGYESRASIVGRSCDDLYDDRNEREELIGMLRDVGSLTGVELCLKRRDGGKFWALENATLVKDAESGAELIEGTLVDISSLKIAEEQMEFQAYHDVLTLLPNRRMFIDRLTLALAQNRRAMTVLAVMFVDLDHFKNVNDTMGHTAGDELLLAVADRLLDAVREEDTVARLGGDEFTILVGGMREPDDAVRIADKVLSSIQRPIKLGDRDLNITASIGIALYPDDGTDAETLLKNADSALYRAKELGRDNYQLCTAQLKIRTMERSSLESNLRGAVERDELWLNYQPLVRLDTGEITGCEALLRWRHPERGILMPDHFIRVAEESRLIIPIGTWALEEACRQAKKWHDEGFGRLRVAVNVSVKQLQQRDLPDIVRRIVGEAGIDPHLLDIELTESGALQNLDVTLDSLLRLREMGVSVAIDDFGTGYSSLNYLKNLPIDCVKIDRRFVRDLGVDPGDTAIVIAVINIARMLRLRVVAEGVETPAQVRFLKGHGCFEIQGSIYSNPLPAEAFGALLRGTLPEAYGADGRTLMTL